MSSLFAMAGHNQTLSKLHLDGNARANHLVHSRGPAHMLSHSTFSHSLGAPILYDNETVADPIDFSTTPWLWVSHSTFQGVAGPMMEATSPAKPRFMRHQCNTIVLDTASVSVPDLVLSGDVAPIIVEAVDFDTQTNQLVVYGQTPNLTTLIFTEVYGRFSHEALPTLKPLATGAVQKDDAKKFHVTVNLPNALTGQELIKLGEMTLHIVGNFKKDGVPGSTFSEGVVVNIDLKSLDTDDDGHPDLQDNAPAIATPEQEDADGDGIADAKDNCTLAATNAQTNTDSDAQGDVCDTDDDNDGLTDAEETALGTKSLASDSDGDGIADKAAYALLAKAPPAGQSGGLTLALSSSTLQTQNNETSYGVVIAAATDLLLEKNRIKVIGTNKSIIRKSLCSTTFCSAPHRKKPARSSQPNTFFIKTVVKIPDATLVPSFARDLNENKRPLGNRFDIGAHEIK